MTSDTPQFVLVTGLSGAGKTQALRFLEDLGYYCVDNLPAPLVPTFAELVTGPGSPRKRIAVCVDARTGEGLKRLPAYLDSVAELGIRPDIFFLESSDEVLIQRYSESRRRHPSSPTGSVEEGIQRERALLEPIRARADLVVDTSSIAVSELRERIDAAFLAEKKERRLLITVLSFGFKFGVPAEADLVFDVRFLPNPYYDDELRPLTGNEPEVRDFVMSSDDAHEFMERMKGLLKFLLPRYAAEPKSYLTIAVGCTGGRHRSVAITQALMLFLRDLKYDARLRHRDIDRPLRGSG
ncbi:MAG TPA: RNase adapter RapZ [Candidatus Hydrogenedentes bacterium]|nr:RNase adapter RapZ [Candidatus Hydrogenedentota bacterium]